MPPVLPPTDTKKNNSKTKLSITSPISSTSNLSDQQTNAITDFFHFWHFVNDLLAITVKPLSRTVSSRVQPSHTNGDGYSVPGTLEAGDRVRRYLVQVISSTFFRSFLGVKLASISNTTNTANTSTNGTNGGEEEYMTLMEYLCDMWLDVSDDRLLDAMVETVLGCSAERGSEAGVFVETLMRHVVAKNEKVRHRRSVSFLIDFLNS